MKIRLLFLQVVNLYIKYFYRINSLEMKTVIY